MCEANAHLKRRFLLDMMPKNSVCLEIGVWRGMYSELILEVVKPKKLFLIDPYIAVPEAQNSFWGNQNQDNLDKMYVSVLNKFKKHIYSGEVVIIRERSSYVADFFEDNFFDWIYIDGNHKYEYVYSDLVNYAPKVKSGGFICGDDYTEADNTRFGGVKKAVWDYIAPQERSIVPYVFRGRQFILKKRDNKKSNWGHK